MPSRRCSIPFVSTSREPLAAPGTSPTAAGHDGFLADRLDKPVLLEGPAGVGKTELAKALAAATGRRLLRLQCYEGQDETKALYEWDYGKQLLYTQILREKIGEISPTPADLRRRSSGSARRRASSSPSAFSSPARCWTPMRSAEPVCC